MKTFILIWLLVTSVHCLAQDFSFTNEAAGNKVYAESALLQPTNRAIIIAVREPEIDSTAQNEDPFKELIAIKAVHNSTTRLVTFTWENRSKNNLVSFTLHTPSNQALQFRKLFKNDKEIQLDFSIYPPGIYIAVFTTQTGFLKDYTIVKK